MTTTMNTPPPPTHDQLIAGLKSQIAALKAALDKALAENVELRRKITPTQAIGKLYGATPDHGGQP
jgi:hypothetical protein